MYRSGSGCSTCRGAESAQSNRRRYLTRETWRGKSQSAFSSGYLIAEAEATEPRRQIRSARDMRRRRVCRLREVRPPPGRDRCGLAVARRHGSVAGEVRHARLPVGLFGVSRGSDQGRTKGRLTEVGLISRTAVLLRVKTSCENVCGRLEYAARLAEFLWGCRERVGVLGERSGRRVVCLGMHDEYAGRSREWAGCRLEWAGHPLEWAGHPWK
jgi:hypothetical protein